MTLCRSRTSRDTSHVASDRYWDSRVIFVANRRRCPILRCSDSALVNFENRQRLSFWIAFLNLQPTDRRNCTPPAARKIRKDLVLSVKRDTSYVSHDVLNLEYKSPHTLAREDWLHDIDRPGGGRLKCLTDWTTKTTLSRRISNSCHRGI
jgi:hypothetical protein